jgi:hypothetical protein
MSKAKPLVGFDRYIEKAWMDYAAQLAVDGMKLPDANGLLDQYLSLAVNGETSRRKTKNILTATWIKTGEAEALFKKEAISLFACANGAERLALHYGMCIATYPFFLSLGKVLGRLFKLQDEVTNTEFYRRVIESIGDRDSIKRAAARYLQSLIEWGLIEQAGKAAVKPCAKIQLRNSELITWLYSSVFFSSDRERLSLDDITSDPVWFPFEIPHGYFNYSNSSLIEVVHQGASDTLLSLGAK